MFPVISRKLLTASAAAVILAYTPAVFAQFYVYQPVIPYTENLPGQQQQEAAYQQAQQQTNPQPLAQDYDSYYAAPERPVHVAPQPQQAVPQVPQVPQQQGQQYYDYDTYYQPAQQAAPQVPQQQQVPPANAYKDYDNYYAAPTPLPQQAQPYYPQGNNQPATGYYPHVQQGMPIPPQNVQGYNSYGVPNAAADNDSDYQYNMYYEY